MQRVEIRFPWFPSLVSEGLGVLFEFVFVQLNGLVFLELRMLIEDGHAARR